MSKENSDCGFRLRCEPNMGITGNFLLDAAKIGTGFRQIDTPEAEYPTLVRTGLGLLQQSYAQLGRPVSQEQLDAVLKFYDISPDPQR